MKTPIIDDSASLLLGALIEQFCFPQVEFPFDAAPRYIGQDASPILLVDVPAFGVDQQKLDLIVQVAEVSVAIVKRVAMLDVLQPMALTDPDRPKDFFRKIPGSGELIEPV
jgi:hypothetical protein